MKQVVCFVFSFLLFLGFQESATAASSAYSLASTSVDSHSWGYLSQLRLVGSTSLAADPFDSVDPKSELSKDFGLGPKDANGAQIAGGLEDNFTMEPRSLFGKPSKACLPIPPAKTCK
jgi:hypothetical protein